jgi:teichuronic acid biosynthesis glycosyltransferase TuaG
MPTVSVIMPAHNAERFIAAAVDSVLAQTLRDWELIVVDDGSTDGTRDVLARYTDPRITVVSRARRGGAAAARNAALAVARGEFVANLDADDRWLPAKLQRQVEAAAREPAVGFFYTESSSIDEAGEIVTLRMAGPHLPVTCRDLMTGLLPYQTSSVMMRRSLLDDAPYPEDLRLAQDNYVHILTLWRAGERSRFVDEPLNQYRVHPASAIRRADGMERGRYIAAAIMKLLPAMEAVRPVPGSLRRAALAYTHFALAWYCIDGEGPAGRALRELALCVRHDPRWTLKCLRQVAKLVLGRARSRD